MLPTGDEKLAARLAGQGIHTVGDLSLASAAQVGVALGMSDTRARSFVDMAALIFGLTVAGFPNEVVEALVKGAGISSLAQLADADTDQVYAACQEAIRQGRVKVPRAFTLSRDDVRKWVEMARSALS